MTVLDTLAAFAALSITAGGVGLGWFLGNVIRRQWKKRRGGR